MGKPGTAIHGGFLVEKEKDSSLTGQTKYQTYSDMLANTSIVSTGVRFFLSMLSKSQWRVAAPEGSGEEGQRLADLVEEIIHDMRTPWHRVIRRAALYRMYGFSVQEWTAKRRDDGVIGLLDIAPRAQLTIERWDMDSDGEILGVIQRDPQSTRDFYIPRGKLVYLVDDSLNDSPEGLGLFRHLIKSAKKLEHFELLESWGFQTDIRGIPVARAPLAVLQQLVNDEVIDETTASSLRAPFEQFIDKHNRNPALGMLIDSQVYRADGENRAPSGTPMWDIELLKGDSGPHKEMADAIQRLEREMARMLGVEQLLLGTDSRGSHALSRDKSQTFGMMVDSSLLEIREACRKDILGPLWDLNGWDRTLMPEFKTDAIQYRSVEEVTSALVDMAQAGAPLDPSDPAINEVRDQIGMSRVPEELQEMQLARQEAAAEALLNPPDDDPDDDDPAPTPNEE